MLLVFLLTKQKLGILVDKSKKIIHFFTNTLTPTIKIIAGHKYMTHCFATFIAVSLFVITSNVKSHS